MVKWKESWGERERGPLPYPKVNSLSMSSWVLTHTSPSFMSAATPSISSSMHTQELATQFEMSNDTAAWFESSVRFHSFSLHFLPMAALTQEQFQSTLPVAMKMFEEIYDSMAYFSFRTATTILKSREVCSRFSCQFQSYIQIQQLGSPWNQYIEPLLRFVTCEQLYFKLTYLRPRYVRNDVATPPFCFL